MRAKGLMTAFVLVPAIVYLLWFTKTGKKTNLEMVVDRGLQAQAELTKVNMQSLQKIVLTYIANEGQTPKTLQDLRTAGLLMAGAVDAWGKSVRYERISDSSFRLTSTGKDGLIATADDIVLEY
jgi:hypothetical protein